MTPTIILITGANSGLGYPTTLALAHASPSSHIILGCRSPTKAPAAKAQLESTQIKCTHSTLHLDVTSQPSITAAATHVEQCFGHPDVLINNAAIGNNDPDVQTRFSSCLATNVMGPAMVASTFRPLLLEAENPYSIYIGSGQRTLCRNIHLRNEYQNPSLPQ